MKILSYILLILMIPCLALSGTLTGDATYGGYMSASSVRDGYTDDGAFDGSSTVSWCSLLTNPVNVDGSCWIQITFPAAKIIESIQIQGWPYAVANANMKDFGVFGSTTGAFSGEEVELLDDTCPGLASGAWSDWFDFDTTGSYKYYRILQYSTNHTAAYGRMTEMKLEETEPDMTIEVQGNYINIYNGTGIVDQPYVLTFQGNYIDIYNSTVFLTRDIVTNSTELIASTPAYDEVDGYWIGEIVLQGNYLDIYNGNQSTLTKADELQGVGNYLDIYNGTITKLTRITDSMALIETPPAYDEVKGAWAETVYAQGNYLNIYNGNIPYLFPSWFEAADNYVDIYNHHLGIVKWQGGITYAPGAEWYNDELTYVSGGSGDTSADMIVFDGF